MFKRLNANTLAVWFGIIGLPLGIFFWLYPDPLGKISDDVIEKLDREPWSHAEGWRYHFLGNTQYPPWIQVQYDNIHKVNNLAFVDGNCALYFELGSDSPSSLFYAFTDGFCNRINESKVRKKVGTIDPVRGFVSNNGKVTKFALNFFEPALEKFSGEYFFLSKQERESISSN